MASQMTVKRRKYITQLNRTGMLLCGLCGYRIATIEEITVDHIIPKSKGGPNHTTNLQPAHKICNELKSNRELDTWLSPPMAEELKAYASHHLDRDLAVHRYGDRFGKIHRPANRGYRYRKSVKRRKERRYDDE